MRGVWDSEKRATVLGASSWNLDEQALLGLFRATKPLGKGRREYETNGKSEYRQVRQMRNRIEGETQA